MEINIIIFFTIISLIVYAVLGGSDFGVGILEALGSITSSQKKHLQEAMSPVWEANHVWLIVGIVLIFAAFPTIFQIITIYLHVPILMILFGIIFRGISFTFNHYDPTHNYTKIYDIIFSWSSVWTAYWFGVTIASVGRLINKIPQFDSYTTTYVWHDFIDSWTGLYPLISGLFAVSLCAFLASIRGVQNTKNDTNMNNSFRSKSKWSLNFMILFICFMIFMRKKENLCLLYQPLLPNAPLNTLNNINFAIIFGLLIVIPMIFILFRIFKTQK